MRLYTIPSSRDFSKILSILNSNRTKLEIPISQPSRAYFPDFLKSILGNYLNFYVENLQPIIDEHNIYDSTGTEKLYHEISDLIEGINKSIDFYYNGDIRLASETFDNALDNSGFTKNTRVETIPKNYFFYRARPSGSRLTRKEIFHNPFENRHLVTTNRYSIPGLPALYLGGSTYVCWEEYNQTPIKNLYFSLFKSELPLKVYKIQRLNDLISALEEDEDPPSKIGHIIRYLLLLPLSFACSVKSKEQDATFKPEYIIPQLLLQYVTKRKGVDGIMFPSTKVNYENISGIDAYNYVFPVKTKGKTGYCSELVKAFQITIPTSIDIEALIDDSPISDPLRNLYLPLNNTISIIEGVNTPYISTSFGRIEFKMLTRPVAKIY